eukprot:3363720-Prymnesium_polylepis.1
MPDAPPGAPHCGSMRGKPDGQGACDGLRAAVRCHAAQPRRRSQTVRRARHVATLQAASWPTPSRDIRTASAAAVFRMQPAVQWWHCSLSYCPSRWPPPHAWPPMKLRLGACCCVPESRSSERKAGALSRTPCTSSRK